MDILVRIYIAHFKKTIKTNSESPAGKNGLVKTLVLTSVLN